MLLILNTDKDGTKVRHNFCKTTICFLLLLSPQLSQALTVSAGLGLGTTKMTNETTESEGPFTQIFSIEKLHDSRIAFGVEHLRSMTSKLVTSASFIGIMAKYYLTAAPSYLTDMDQLDPSYSVIQDYSVFLASGFGYGQSSRLPNDVGLSSNTAGIYASPRLGVDYQLDKSLGLRSELIYALTIMGKGSLSQMGLTASIYWIF